MDACSTQALTEVSGIGPAPSWGIPAALPPLPDNTIHLWRLTAAQQPSAAARLPLLEPAEQMRAERLLFAEDRDQFLACRSILRLLLSHYSGGVSQPRSLSLVTGPQGKPALAGSELRFNLSHTRGLALFAFARGIEVGVDVETVRATGDLEDVARQSFAPEENAALDALALADRTDAFYRCWTRKEALLKSDGSGLYRNLNSFAVPIRPAATGEVLVDLAEGWTIAHLDLAPDAPGAVAWRRSRTAPALVLLDMQRSVFLEAAKRT